MKKLKIVLFLALISVLIYASTASSFQPYYFYQVKNEELDTVEHTFETADGSFTARLITISGCKYMMEGETLTCYLDISNLNGKIADSALQVIWQMKYRAIINYYSIGRYSTPQRYDSNVVEDLERVSGTKDREISIPISRFYDKKIFETYINNDNWRKNGDYVGSFNPILTVEIKDVHYSC